MLLSCLPLSYRELGHLSDKELKSLFAEFVGRYNERVLPAPFYEPVKPKVAKEHAPVPTTGDVSILLFYAYVPGELMTRCKRCYLMYWLELRVPV
jgi:hypothetical protein